MVDMKLLLQLRLVLLQPSVLLLQLGDLGLEAGNLARLGVDCSSCILHDSGLGRKVLVLEVTNEPWFDYTSQGIALGLVVGAALGRVC